MDLDGKNAVVTGGGRGIGAAAARALAEAGARVLVAARTRSQIEAMADGRSIWAEPCDVTQPASVRSLEAAAERLLGAVDILVNNAGVASAAPVPKITLEDWNRLMAVNATGTFLCTQAFLPGMIARGWGRIVNIASVAGISGGPYIAAYAASKHAVLGFTRSAAAEVGPKGVTVNAICPGYVDTEMTRESIARIVEKTGRTLEEARRSLESQSPQGRLIQPEEVAALVLSLCGDSAKGTNGQAIIMDGGEGLLP